MTAQLTTHFVAERINKKTGKLESINVKRNGRIDNEARCSEIAAAIKRKTGYTVTSVWIDSTNYDCDQHRAEINFCDELGPQRKPCSCCWNKQIFKFTC